MPELLVRRTQEVLEHHIQAFIAKDTAAYASDYSEESVLISNTAPEPIRGLKAIRGLFEQLKEALTPEVLSQVKVTQQVIEGEIAYITWSAGSAFPFVTDTYVIRDGKILVQTAASYVPRAS